MKDQTSLYKVLVKKKEPEKSGPAEGAGIDAG
jgi:hypothetical protein